jgi:hypothetical protein
MSRIFIGITNALRKIASLRMLGVLFLLFLISLMVINGKPFGTAQLMEITGGVNIPDVEMTGYSPQRVYDILTAQGEAGRAFYLHYIVPQDFPLPLFYALFFAIALTLLARRLFPANHPLQRIGLLGLCAGLADWGENLSLLTLLVSYPQRLDTLASVASTFTVIKATLSLLNIGLILAGFVWLVVKTLAAKTSAQKSN